MARIPRDVVEAVRDRTDIVSVVQRHVKLERRGGSWVGLCPFHQEKTPSFHVIPNKAFYHCFGCQANGDVFRFLMEIEGLGFTEAVKELAEAAGVEVPERELTPEERRRLAARATLRDVLDAAAEWFASQLWTTPAGARARDYLTGRGLDPDLAREAGVGFAPPGWTNLLDHLQKKGFRPELIQRAGLAKTRDRGGFYDVFRDRVILPIRDERGRPIAFGGRLLEGDGPKYLNSPETELYTKSDVLYGLDHARRAIGKEDRAILVEGYFDVLSMWQAGFHETVATCGTALTEGHVRRLRRLTRDLVVLLDADEAGARAAERTLPLVVTSGMRARRLQLASGKDPDDFLQEHGAEAMSKALHGSKPLLHWVVQRKLDAYGLDVAAKERVLDEVVDLLGELSPARLSELAAQLRLPEEMVVARARQRRRRGPPPAEAPAAPRGWKPHRDIVHLLWLLVHRHDQVADLIMRIDPTLLEHHEEIRQIVARLSQGEPPVSILDDAQDPGVRRTLAAIIARERLYTADEAAAAVGDLVSRLATPGLEGRLRSLQDDIQAAAQVGDRDTMRALLGEKSHWSTVRRELRRARVEGDTEHILDLLAASEDRPPPSQAP